MLRRFASNVVATAIVALMSSSCFPQADTIGNYANIAREFTDLHCIVSPWRRAVHRAMLIFIE